MAGVISLDKIPVIENVAGGHPLYKFLCNAYGLFTRTSTAIPPSDCELVWQTTCILDHFLFEDLKSKTPHEYVNEVLRVALITRNAYEPTLNKQQFEHFWAIIIKMVHACLLARYGTEVSVGFELIDKTKAEYQYLRFLDNIIYEHQDWLRQLQQLMPSYGQDGRYLSTLIESQMPDNPYCHGLKPAVEEPEEVMLEGKDEDNACGRLEYDEWKRKMEEEKPPVVVWQRQPAEYRAKFALQQMSKVECNITHRNYFNASKNAYQYGFVYRICEEQYGGKNVELPQYNNCDNFIRDMGIQVTSKTVKKIPNALEPKSKSKYPNWKFCEGSNFDSAMVSEGVDVVSRFLSIFTKGI